MACAALNRGLRSILILDCQPSALGMLGDLLAQMLTVVTGQPVSPVVLGSAETEDDLWGSLTLRANSEDGFLAWQAGRLANAPGDGTIKLVFIPDLPRLSLVAARACITLMGAETAQLDRHGQHLL